MSEFNIKYRRMIAELKAMQNIKNNPEFYLAVAEKQETERLYKEQTNYQVLNHG